ncbi:MAG: DNRLRE domain-containing protein [Anaerolineales bacterium]|jgi:hypothetical protein
MQLNGTHSEIEYLPQGKAKLVISSAPVAYRDGSRLKRIISDWGSSGDPQRAHIVSAAPFLVSVGDGGLRRIHPTRELDVWAEIGAPTIKIGGDWQQFNMGSPTRMGNKLAWSFSQADLLILMGGHFLKMDIALKGGWEPPGAQFAFPVGLQGLTWNAGRLYKEGRGARKAEPVMRLRHPVVYDAGNQDDVRPIDWQLVNVGGQNYLLFTLPDLAGMSAPVIDPTLTLQPDETAGLDCDIRSISPDKNHNGFNLNVGNASNNLFRHLIKFDLSSLDGSEEFDSVTYTLTINLDQCTQPTQTLSVYRTKRAWTEGIGDDPDTEGATWNEYAVETSSAWQTPGGFGANDCEQTDIGNIELGPNEPLNEPVDIPLTATNKAELDLGDGWLVKNDEALNNRYRFADSGDGTPAYRPKLTIVYDTEALKSKLYTGVGL